MAKAGGTAPRPKRGGGDSERLVLDGGKKMQLRGGRREDISEEQMVTFFATLADTCNVVRSARAAGFSANWAYRRRRTDAAFRAGWAVAVSEGYAKLELILLERAMNGTVKAVIGRDGSESHIREYSTALAIALLKRHADLADSADADLSGEEVEDARERILEKLARIAARAKRQGEAPDETR